MSHNIHKILNSKPLANILEPPHEVLPYNNLMCRMGGLHTLKGNNEILQEVWTLSFVKKNPHLSFILNKI